MKYFDDPVLPISTGIGPVAKKLATLLQLVLVSALCGCAVGPRYQAPELVMPAHFDGATSEAASGIESASDPARWWQSLHDPVLDGLVARALEGNLDLQTARSRIAVARAQLGAASAGLLPELNAKAGINRIDFSKNAGLSSLASALGGGGGGGGGNGSTANRGNTAGQGVAGPGSGITTWSLGLDASWELDLFGGVASGVASSQARLEAAEWQTRDLQIALVAEVASDYLKLRALQEQIAIVKQELGRQRALLKLVSARRQAGFISELPQRQQAYQLSNVAASLPQLLATAQAQTHALGVLTGEGDDMQMSKMLAGADGMVATVQLQQLQQLPVGLPSDLLRRRPDVRAAERELAAANADIGVATADLYPRFNLLGMAELISTSLTTLFQRASLQTSANAGISLPIFDGGKRRATLASVQANADIALLAYKKSVLVAVQDVEDALADYRAEQTRHDELQHGLDDAQRVEKLARASYTAGMVDFREVLDAQAGVLNGRNSLSQSQGALLTRLARLYKALGGGWDIV